MVGRRKMQCFTQVIMWLGFIPCWGVGGWISKADTAAHWTGGGSALPAADEAAQTSHQSVPIQVQAFPTQKTHLSMGMNLFQYLCV